MFALNPCRRGKTAGRLNEKVIDLTCLDEETSTTTNANYV